MKVQNLFFFALLLSTSIVYAQTPSGITDIYLKAVEKDAALAAELAAARAELESEVQSFASLLPTITATANAKYGKTKSTYASAPRLNTNKTSNNNGVNVKLTQTLFNLKTFTTYAQSKITVDISKINLQLIEQDLILRVSKAYFDILSAEEKLSVAKSQTIAFKENLERAILTLRVGTATKTDKLEAQARFDLAQANELNALNLLAIAKQTLASIIGEEPGPLKALSKEASLLRVDPQKMDSWVDEAIGNNLDLKLSQFGIDNAKLDIKRLKNDRMPVLNLVANAGLTNQYISFLNTNNRNTTTSLGINLSVPLYTGGLMTSRIKQAEALRIKQNFNHTNVQRQVTLKTQKAYLTALNGFQQVSALKQASVSSKSALEATRKGMEVGVRTNLDLLNSQTQFFETERDYTIAKYDYLLQILDLKAAAGNLADTDIKNLDQLLEI